MPPPTQRPQQSPGQNTPQLPGQTSPAMSMEMLTRQGFEVKAISRASDRAPNFVVILQRAGEVRTCLMRIQRQPDRAPRQDSVCF